MQIYYIASKKLSFFKNNLTRGNTLCILQWNKGKVETAIAINSQIWYAKMKTNKPASQDLT